MTRFDLQLLMIFDEIYKTGSVTRAAENLGLAQPTVSIGLNKLRKHFGDILFSRTTGGMEPTPHAQNVIDDVRAATAALHSALRHRVVFDPKEGEREFKVCMTDISEIVLLPKLLNYLKRHAPTIRIDVIKISTDTPNHLQDGEVDLAVGFMPHLEAGFYQQKLFDQNFVCLAAVDHPRIGATLTRKAFLQEGHVLVKSSGTGHSIVDKIMANEGIDRKIVVRVPSFLGVARIVAQTDFLVTVPERFGTAMANQEKIRILASPIRLPNFSVKQHWHERFHADPANKWLRRIIAQLFKA
ncbi:MAG: LysR family transcriptional regulator [Herminiimonas sp.]|nr:LysR family transcriptional regulator [Herminiimonas sp.]